MAADVPRCRAAAGGLIASDGAPHHRSRRCGSAARGRGEWRHQPLPVLTFFVVDPDYRGEGIGRRLAHDAPRDGRRRPIVTYTEPGRRPIERDVRSRRPSPAGGRASARWRACARTRVAARRCRESIGRGAAGESRVDEFLSPRSTPARLPDDRLEPADAANRRSTTSPIRAVLLRDVARAGRCALRGAALIVRSTSLTATRRRARAVARRRAA